MVLCGKKIASTLGWCQKNYRSWLRSRRGRVFQIYFQVFITHIYYPLRKIYDERYGLQEGGAPTTGRPDAESVGNSDRVQAQGASSSSSSGRAKNQNRWQWRDLPQLTEWPMRYRTFTTIWMVYVVIKYSIPRQLDAIIENVFRTSLPGNCYLLGRFVLADEVKRVTAIFFASYHLFWRLIQSNFCNELEMSALYFLMLDDRDLIRYYDMLADASSGLRSVHSSKVVLANRKQSLALNLGKKNLLAQEKPVRQQRGLGPVDPHTRMMHDVMSYKVPQNSFVMHNLRPNRTLEANRHLTDQMTRLTLICGSVFAICACMLIPSLLIMGWRSDRIVNDYPGCNPKLEQMIKSGQRAPDSRWYLGEHFKFAFLCDIIENAILWSESGLVVVFGPSLLLLLNTDLLVYWSHIHDKIVAVLHAARSMHDIDEWLDHEIQKDDVLDCVQYKPTHNRREWLSGLVFDLQMEIQDMIKQIKQADQYLTDCMTTLVGVWFSLFGFFIYATTNEPNGRLPLPLKLTLIFVAIVLSLLCISLLRLQRCSIKSYPHICSLMAYDRSEYKLNFCLVIDYFIYDRTCYTLFRSKRMTTTFYLTIVGWSFSCYFILSKIY